MRQGYTFSTSNSILYSLEFPVYFVSRGEQLHTWNHECVSVSCVIALAQLPDRNGIRSPVQFTSPYFKRREHSVRSGPRTAAARLPNAQDVQDSDRSNGRGGRSLLPCGFLHQINRSEASVDTPSAARRCVTDGDRSDPHHPSADGVNSFPSYCIPHHYNRLEYSGLASRSLSNGATE